MAMRLRLGARHREGDLPLRGEGRLLLAPTNCWHATRDGVHRFCDDRPVTSQVSGDLE